jgi:hypothetical protein
MDVCEPSRLPRYRLHPYNVRPPMQHRLHIRPARKQSPPLSRNRLLYAGLALVVVAAGLLWRASFMPLPPGVSKYGGDALWALMVFVGFGFLLPRASTLTIALLALTFSWGVEFSQLYHAPWIDAVRATIPGRLVLGNTFNWPDLPAYVVGIVLGAVAELWWRWRWRA